MPLYSLVYDYARGNALWKTEAIDAVGSVNGHATPGYAANQLWSTTATTWASYAWDTGGQTSSYGGSHSANGAGNTYWSNSANYWRVQFDTEWQNARDPQGYAYSYPGQAANAVFWYQSANYWKNDRDAQYNNYLAWGGYAHWDSNVWNTRYDAGHAQGQTDYQPAALWDANIAGATQYAPYNGYYMGRCRVNFGEYTGSPSWFSDANTGQWWVSILVNGGEVARSQWIGSDGAHNMGTNSLYAAFGPTYYGAGTSFSMSYGTHTDTPVGAVTFVPTPAYPH